MSRTIYQISSSTFSYSPPNRNRSKKKLPVNRRNHRQPFSPFFFFRKSIIIFLSIPAFIEKKKRVRIDIVTSLGKRDRIHSEKIVTCNFKVFKNKFKD